MITAIALLGLAVWCVLLFGHHGFWRGGPVLAPARPTGRSRVTAVIPARDEADHLRECLGSLLAQDFAGDFSIVLVDDNSTDGTGEIANALAESDPRLKIVTGAPLESGWSGKMWAVSQGLAHEAARQADYVLLTDADIAHAPDHVSRLVAKAERDWLDLVSEMVRLNCRTFSERALIPAFVFFFQMLYPFARAAMPGPKGAAAAGGVMLVARAALDRIDGVHRIRGALIDDVALAREVKREGRIWLGHAEGARSLRVYGTPGEIFHMIARTAYTQLKYSPPMLLGCVLGMAVMYLAPVYMLFRHGVALTTGVLALLIMAYAFQPTLRRYGRSPFWGFALPAIALFYLAATIASALRHYAGRGGGWKNRVYAGRQA